ncbi:unnamed protein product [Adineta ricciae]|uniref:Uncharacterized protein n=1 Tax=Adineta ricciae TaxID=249248 RepID=A0A815PG11_ADIRI|nr:unnamed protein product [Adineta ricciae]
MSFAVDNKQNLPESNNILFAPLTQSTSSSSSATLWTAITLLKKTLHSLTTTTATLNRFHHYPCILHSCSQISTLTNTHPRLSSHCSHLQHPRHPTHSFALLEALSYDISVPTPDDFFSYFSNLANNTDPKIKTIIDEARLALSSPSLPHQTFGVLHNYSPSVVVLSVMYNYLTSNSWMSEQVKKIIIGKKDGDQYVKQLIHCIAQLQSVMTS